MPKIEFVSETTIDGKRVGVLHKKPSPGSYGYTAFIIDGEQDELQWVEKKYGAEFAAKCKALPAYQEATAEPTWDKENNSWNKPKKIGAPNKTAEPNQPSVADSNGNRVMAGSTVQVVDHAGRLMYDETFRVVSVEKANFGTTWVTLDQTPPRHKSNKIQARFVSKAINGPQESAHQGRANQKPTLAQIEQLNKEKADALERERQRLKLRAWRDRLSEQAIPMYELIKSFKDVLGEEAKRIIAAIETEENGNAEEA